ncbi:outer membrane protein [Sulfurovum sp. ST-21]|uniref:Porin family protein n=1 Tax=Sulfurovum indicum TaxID=2779528 RepID=A0A7M1S6B3_9BACT|nr:porin family protein [Sulfurovum indicum]QOR62632.1 porin family protein [Sulfurovum indicum]
MKKRVFAALAVAAWSSFAVAGGDMLNSKEVEPAVALPVVIDEPADESGFYAGLALSALSARDASVSMDLFSGQDGQDRLGNVTLQAGYNFNTYMALEGRYTTSVSQEDRVEMEGWSLFVKPQYPLDESFSIYALLGFGNVTLNGVNGINIDVDDTGFQWGVGMSYLIMEDLSLFTDYTSLGNDMDGFYDGASKADADAVTVGVTYSF